MGDYGDDYMQMKFCMITSRRESVEGFDPVTVGFRI